MFTSVLSTASDPRVAFTIGNFTVQWYGLLIVCGMLLGLLYACWQAKKIGITSDDAVELFLWLIPLAIVFARLLYVLPRAEEYFGDNGLEGWDKFVNIIAIWKGGITIIGGLLGGLLGAVFFTLRHKKQTNFLNVVDLVVVPVFIGQIIGRWGNFVNAEAYGWSEGVEKLPWRMTVGNVYIDNKLRPDIQFVHPTFLYESLWNLVGFIIIQLIYRKKKANGEIFSLYMLWYGFGRGFIEMLRTDSLYLFNTSIKFSVFTGFVCFVGGTALLIYLLKKSKKSNAELAEYEKAYSAVDTYNTVDVKNEADDKELSEKLDKLENAKNDESSDKSVEETIDKNNDGEIEK